MMQTRRIAVFQLDNFQQSPFGKYFSKLAREFLSRGLEVDFLGTSDLGFESLPEGTHGLLIGQPRGRVPSHFKGIPDLVRYIRDKAPDAIIANGPSFVIVTAIAKTFARSDVKILANLHSLLSRDIASKAYRGARMYPYILPLAFRLAHQVVAVSDHVAEDYAQVTGYPRERIAIQPWFFVTDEDIDGTPSVA